MTDDEDDEKLPSGVDSAIREAIALQTGAAMVTDYVVVAACVDEDGSRYLANYVSPGLPYWTAVGMAASVQQTRGPEPAWTRVLKD